ncbi:PKD domain-containing protein [Phytohabitans sp. LJ34]|uniref:PKD domain-containing protein n=1 Tax=Phytohabitans sp. LJ34 TaxID=3452217 RepID=UPI003F896686
MITNNTVRQRCTDGIRVDGPSSGVSVQNNFVQDNGNYDQNFCLGVVANGADLGIYDGGVGSTVADYNNTIARSGDLAYAWNGTRMDLAGFRAASGQAAHDRAIVNLRDNYDSANSAAPGYPATDRIGSARVDDPAVPNTGAGPVTYADRGSIETARLPAPRTNVALDLAAMSVTVDASASEPGIVPIASYEFDFGNGTVVKQTSPLITYRYGRTGQFSVKTTAVGTDGRSAWRSDFVEFLPVTATMGLLSRPLLKYVGASGTQTILDVSQASLTADAQFDLADAGSGQVALFHKRSGKYISVGGIDGSWMQMNALSVDNAARFTLIRNADGSISFKSIHNGFYVGLHALDIPVLSVSRNTIGAWEKFYQVKTSDAGRAFKASANGLFVSAQQAGAQPLKAAARIAQSWERFDIIDLGGGKVALFARINSMLVAAESGGSKPLLAGRVAVGTWETFTLIRNSDGTVSFRAAANNLYVSAERAGAQPLIASRPAINTWEKYTIF